MYSATLTPLIPPFGKREVRRGFVKQYRHLSETMMWHIYDFRFDKAAKIEADKFATGWLNISHHMAIFTRPDN
jgi:hypothetical protein